MKINFKSGRISIAVATPVARCIITGVSLFPVSAIVTGESKSIQPDVDIISS